MCLLCRATLSPCAFPLASYTRARSQVRRYGRSRLRGGIPLMSSEVSFSFGFFLLYIGKHFICIVSALQTHLATTHSMSRAARRDMLCRRGMQRTPVPFSCIHAYQASTMDIRRVRGKFRTVSCASHQYSVCVHKSASPS